jgi:hypothetical protein
MMYYLLRQHFNKFLLALIVFAQVSVYAQPAIQWDKTFGSSLNTASSMGTMEQTADGGYILAQASSSRIAGDKSENSRGSSDYWIIKVSANGAKQWDKTIGGPGSDFDPTIHQTSDGGFIIGGISGSPIGGEKSEKSRGGLDFWVVKLDMNGNKVWDKTIGSNSSDDLVDVRQTADGGYILGGTTDGGVGGDKTGPALGRYDYWIVKLSATGSIVWDKTLGTWDEDFMRCMTLTSDGGFVFAGGDQYYEYGDSGYKLMKVAADGTKVWERKIQGTHNAEIYDIEQTPDNGFILGGSSYQSAGGDQTEDSFGDYWVVKLNADLSVAWSNVLNTLFYNDGRGTNYFADLAQTPDGGYAVLGYSSEPALGDKSEDAHNGSFDYWLIKLNASGTQVWDKVIGGASYEAARGIISTTDGGLLLVGNSNSDVSFEKTENNKGMSDLWIVKLAPENVSTSPTIIRINAGGPEFTTATKKTFSADKYYSGIDRTSSIASGDILNTTNDVLYQTARCSPAFSYSIPVANGRVDVILHFAETYFGAPGKKGGAGSRRFHVNIEGSRKLTNYDIFVAAGGAMRPSAFTSSIDVKDGVLNIDFLTGAADLPRISAIEVIPVTNFTLQPIADAYVQDGTNYKANFGATDFLDVKKSSSNLSTNRSAYLKFQLPAASGITSAKLRVYGRNHENSNNISLHAYGVNNDSWTENIINKYNAPGASTASLGYVAVNNVYKYYEIDVTSYVKSQQQAGDALVSLLLNDPNNRNTRLIFNSKENGANAPQLIVQTAAVTTSNTREGVEEIIAQAEEEITIFPNPAIETLNINMADWHKVKTVELLNGRSDVVYHSGNKPVQSVNIRELPTGIYFVRIGMVDGSASVRKVLVGR